MKEEIGTNESVVIMSAVRYMLGRSSYGVGAVCDFLKENKDRLTKSNKSVIVRDIKEHFEKFPDTSHADDWMEIVIIFSPLTHTKEL